MVYVALIVLSLLATGGIAGVIWSYQHQRFGRLSLFLFCTMLALFGHPLTQNLIFGAAHDARAKALNAAAGDSASDVQQRFGPPDLIETGEQGEVYWTYQVSPRWVWYQRPKRVTMVVFLGKVIATSHGRPDQ